MYICLTSVFTNVASLELSLAKRLLLIDLDLCRRTRAVMYPRPAMLMQV